VGCDFGCCTHHKLHFAPWNPLGFGERGCDIREGDVRCSWKVCNREMAAAVGLSWESGGFLSFVLEIHWAGNCNN